MTNPDTALTVQQPSAVVAQPQGESAQFLAVIAAAAADPRVDVDKMRALLEMKERMRATEAAIAYSDAMQAAQDEIKPVVRDAENSHTKSRYALLETIDNRIRPIYTKHGFSLSFNSAPAKKDGAVRVICKVRHRVGHAEDHELEGDLDVSGAKGTSNKTSIQGLGSSVSYLRRYLTTMIFNVTFTNEDNDGQGALTEEQKMDLLDAARACNMTTDERQRFIDLIGTDNLESLAPCRYGEIMRVLRAKAKQKENQR